MPAATAAPAATAGAIAATAGVPEFSGATLAGGFVGIGPGAASGGVGFIGAKLAVGCGL